MIHQTLTPDSKLAPDSQLSPEPIRVFHIIIRYPVYFPVYHFRRDIPHFFCRYARKNAPGFTNHSFGNKGSRTDDGIAVHNSSIHNNRPHPDQCIIMQGASMYNSMMSNRNIIAYCCSIALVCAMNAGAILYIDFISHVYKIDVASDNCIKPDAAIISYYYIAYNGCIGSDKTIISELRVNVFYRKYDWHG